MPAAADTSSAWRTVRASPRARPTPPRSPTTPSWRGSRMPSGSPGSETRTTQRPFPFLDRPDEPPSIRRSRDPKLLATTSTAGPFKNRPRSVDNDGVHDKGKPAARRGRKARGLTLEAAQPPKGDGFDAAPRGLRSTQDVRHPRDRTPRPRTHDHRRERFIPLRDHHEAARSWARLEVDRRLRRAEPDQRAHR